MRLPATQSTPLVQPQANARGHQRQLVVIASTMRSGSTLLKALLATASDVSDLPEVNFKRFIDRAREPKLWHLAPQRIIVLKHPAWYHEVASYPQLPEALLPKVIVLVRDAWESVRSLRRMTFGCLSPLVARAVDGVLVRRYWAPVTERLCQVADRDTESTTLVRYEDLIADPRRVTAQLFAFIGSQRTDGVDAYQIPKRGPWRWWTDDNSLHLQSLRVQRGARRHGQPPGYFQRLMTTHSLTHALRVRLNYVPG